MPRKAREKTERAIFHIKARSIVNEIDLFNGKDDVQYKLLVCTVF